MKGGADVEFHMPEQAEWIIEQLNLNGFEAFAVGGCVRDTLLGRRPEDWDITTSAKPQQVKEIFRRTIDTGIEHGTVTVMIDHQGYEVTTYRLDGEYVDGRHPSSVSFTSSLTEDLRRRDFTINAMAYNPDTGLVDVFGGMDDLRDKRIRCVGNPHDRFHEDALRILRAIRFSAQLGFQIQEETYRAISDIAPNIHHVSKERIQMELTKLLLSAHPGRISAVFETGISRYISPGFAEIPWETVTVPTELEPVRHMRWAAFLHGLSSDRASRVMKDLKMDNDTISRVSTLVEWHPVNIKPDKYLIRKIMSQMDRELYFDLLNLKTALPIGEELDRIRALSLEIVRDEDCVSLRQLAVNGSDLIRAGMKPGKAVGALLAELLEVVLQDPKKNSKEYLISMIPSPFPRI